jgi:Icc-related predicted phosphoesterase
VGDVHGALPSVRLVADQLRPLDLDVVLLVGDLLPAVLSRRYETDGRREFRETLQQIRSLLSPTRLIWVPGNHDPSGLKSRDSCDRRALIVRGTRVFGIGGAGPARFGFRYEWGDEEISALRPPRHDILLSHAPPSDTRLDRLASGAHVGSQAIRDIALYGARVLVCGHIHESAGVDRIDNLLMLNAGSLGDPFGRPQYGLVELSSVHAAVTHVDIMTSRTTTLRVGHAAESPATPAQSIDQNV